MDSSASSDITVLFSTRIILSSTVVHLLEKKDLNVFQKDFWPCGEFTFTVSKGLSLLFVHAYYQIPLSFIFNPILGFFPGSFHNLFPEVFRYMLLIITAKDSGFQSCMPV